MRKRHKKKLDMRVPRNHFATIEEWDEYVLKAEPPCVITVLDSTKVMTLPLRRRPNVTSDI